MRNWLIVAGAVVGVLGVGAVLVPSGLEQAFMKLHDKSYDEAQSDFATRWAKGDRSREVANALTELYVRLGDIDHAIDILFTYTEAKPDDDQALARLADLFRDAQRRDDYIKAVERLTKDKPDDVHQLRRLEKLYDMAGRNEERIKVLQTLVHSRDAAIEDHEALADMLASKDDSKGALEVLYNAFRRWPGKATADMAQTFVALVADTERVDLINSVIDPWIARIKDPVSVDAVSGTLAARQLPVQALDVIESSGAYKANVPQTIVLAARIESRLNRTAQAFARVEKLRAAKLLPMSGDDIYVETALRLGKRKDALDHVMARGPENLHPWLQTWVIGQAASLGDTQFLTDMQTRLEAAGPNVQPFVLGRIALALGDRAKAERLANEARPLAHDASTQIAVAGLFADLGDTGKARDLLAEAARDPATLSADDLIQAVPVAVTVKDAARALAMATTLREARPSELAEILYARALTVSGRGREALALLDELGSTSEAAEAAMFEALKGSGQVAEMQKRLYELLDDGAVSQYRRTNYVYMLNDTKTIVAPGAKRIVDGLNDDLEDDATTGNPRLARIEDRKSVV